MKTHNLKLHVLAALMASASVFHVGCGDDDDNATPSNTGGKSGTGGSSTGTGGKSTGTGGSSTGTGGSSTGTGGKSTGTGGIDGTSGAGNSAGSGGEPVVGGGAGGGAGMPGTDGGAGGSGGSAPELPSCDSSHYDATNECYLDCEPNTTSSSEEFLNHCSEAGANCTPFDNTTLDKLVNGVLPPLP